MNSITQDFRKILVGGFIILNTLISYAQLCQGSLGDPIVDLDFGSGISTHAGALPAGMTSYTYSSNDFPIDGSYTIENSTAGSGNIWWSTTDHTGNTGGYMMVVNASLSLTDYFYKNTITGLCPATTYEFAAWVMNLLRAQDLSPPNITFMIEKTDGTLLNSYTTGSIPLQKSAVWKQYGFYFSTPANVSSVVVVMRNNSAGGAPANDIALDDITFRPCGPNLSALVLESSATSDTICEGSLFPVHLEGTVSAGYSNPDYQWQQQLNNTWQDIPGDTALNVPVSPGNLPAGTYSYRLTAGESINISSQQCRVVSNIVSLVVDSRPQARYGLVAPVVCANAGVQFIDSTQSQGTLIYAWSFGDGGTSADKDPVHIYNQPGTYTSSLVVTTSNGCQDTATLTSTIQLLAIPTAKFTVNPSDTSIFHPIIAFTDESAGGTSCKVEWGEGTVTDCTISQFTYTEPGKYLVKEIVWNAAGCTDTAQSTVIIRPEFRFHIPNAFTPNRDGLNDVFKPVLFGVHDYTFIVFNRWGQQLFETSDPAEGWDGYYNGTICPGNCYVYKIILRDDVVDSLKVYTGIFTLVRN